ncbi:MAG: hypothetical protein U0401_00200 [Anaerolineae bacterium]
MGGSAATPVNTMPVNWAYTLDSGQTPQRNVAAKSQISRSRAFKPMASPLI